TGAVRALRRLLAGPRSLLSRGRRLGGLRRNAWLRVALRNEPRDVVRNVAERLERRDRVLCRDLEFVLDREHELRDRERVELDLFERGIALQALGRKLEGAQDDRADGFESRRHEFPSDLSVGPPERTPN